MALSIMNRTAAKDLEVGDAIFFGVDKIKARILKLDECCASSLVPIELRQHATKRPQIVVDLLLARSLHLTDVNMRTSFFRVHLDPSRLVTVAKADSQRLNG